MEFFIFFNSNLNFEFRPVSYRTEPEPVRTGLTGKPVTGQTGPVTDGSVNPGQEAYIYIHSNIMPVNSISQLSEQNAGYRSLAARCCVSDGICTRENVTY